MAKRAARKAGRGAREAPGAASLRETQPDLDSALHWYRKMVTARLFEEEAERAFRRGRIGGYLHVYSGQEAVAAGFLAEMREDDIFFTSYRDHAHALFRGSSLGETMAELFGRVDGLARGKGGSMHLFDVSRGFYGGYAIVGGHIPLAVGAAYALRYKGGDQVCLCFLGDGAMNSGAFHESLNMAGLWGAAGACPLVVIVENNLYAMGTPLEGSSAVTDIPARLSSYAIECRQVDGMDFLAVRQAASRLITEARDSGRPVAAEARTYRFSGHGAADVFQPYRSKEEVSDARRRDPISVLEDRLREAGLLDDSGIEAIRREAEEAVAKAAQFAEESAPPPPQELHRHVYGEGV